MLDTGKYPMLCFWRKAIKQTNKQKPVMFTTRKNVPRAAFNFNVQHAHCANTTGYDYGNLLRVTVVEAPSRGRDQLEVVE